MKRTLLILCALLAMAYSAGTQAQNVWDGTVAAAFAGGTVYWYDWLAKLAFTVVRPTDRPQLITYAISTMIVCIMCPTMSLIATLLFKEPSFGTWVQTWGLNMPMALIWQLLFSGPLTRVIFRALFRRQLAEEAAAH